MSEYHVILNNYGFVWGNVLVERTAANGKKPKFQVIRVYAPNGEGVEILMTPRKLKVSKFAKEKKRRGGTIK